MSDPLKPVEPVEQQLRAQIWKNPMDRQLLGVYADRLAEQGETTRAEYIQLSLLAKPTAAQERRRTALRNKHRGAWLGAARPFIWTWEEDEETPGFVSKCQCQMAKLTKGFDAIRALGPRLVVAVTAPKAKREVDALAKLPLGSLWGLAMVEADAQWITDELLNKLAPTLDGLRELVLHVGEARASDRGWRVVLQHLDALESLELTMGENPEVWVELLIEKPLPRLRRLSVPGWIGKPLRARLAAAVPEVELRGGEERMRYNRSTGYYE
jgi:uncharacterized protein (TIGR02996 family)